MSWTIDSRIGLADGNQIPRLGLGVFQTPKGDATENAVLWAIEAGYKHIDTAAIYGNEEGVGAAIRRSGARREDLFITTKVWNGNQGYEETKVACRESLQRLQLDHVDLYLVHWPVDEKTDDTWRAMIELQQEGACTSIGVSNFGTARLERLLSHTKVAPVINQIELNPFLTQTAVREFCRERKIAVEAYTPLVRGQRLNHPLIADVATQCGKTPAQVMIRWVLQHDVIVFPKSVHKDRIVENADVFDFEITEEDMARLDALNENLVTSWRPGIWDASV